MDDTEVSWECPLTHYTEIASLEFRKTAVKTGHEMAQSSGRLILKGLSNILTLPGALLNRKGPGFGSNWSWEGEGITTPIEQRHQPVQPLPGVC